MKDYKATQTDWVNVEHSAIIHAAEACILELRARVEALEAQASNYLAIPDSSTPPSMATDEELDKTWNFEDTWNGSLRAVYNLGVAYSSGSRLRAARRPKPPNLKEQALEALERMDQFPTTEDKVTILRALEQLND